MQQAIDIQSGLNAYLESKRKTYPCYTNRISALDDPCLRKLFYMRAAWAEAAPHPTSLLGVFETGNALEPIVTRIALEVGEMSRPRWRIVGNQTPVNDALFRKYQISGTIDGLLQVEQADGRWRNTAVLDGKTMSGNIYPRINTYQDLGLYPWTRMYRGQLGLYALAFDLEECAILATNKHNIFEMKLIQWTIDYDYLERLLQKAQAVNEAIELDEPPDGVNDPPVCERCQWLSYCCPDLEPTGNLKVVDNEALEAVMDRLGELSEAATETKALEKQRDEMLTKGQDVAVGRWLITWRQSRSGAWRKTIEEAGVA